MFVRRDVHLEVEMIKWLALFTLAAAAAAAMVREARGDRPPDPAAAPVVARPAEEPVATRPVPASPQIDKAPGQTLIERDELEQAEDQMDAARARGVRVGRGYRQLARRYEAAGRYGDAARANLKSLTQGGGIAGPLRDAARNVHRALLDRF